MRIVVQRVSFVVTSKICQKASSSDEAFLFLESGTLHGATTAVAMKE
jgi:hypothetical protein